MFQDDQADILIAGDAPATLDCDFMPEWRALLHLDDSAFGGSAANAAFDPQQAIWDLLNPINCNWMPTGAEVAYFAPFPSDEHGNPLSVEQLRRNLDAIGWVPCVGTEVAFSIIGNGIY